jgi:hypothetical protein
MLKMAAVALPGLALRPAADRIERRGMTLGAILIIVLVLALLGAVPVWGYNRSWGYAPSGVVGVILVILLILWLVGGLNW